MNAHEMQLRNLAAQGQWRQVQQDAQSACALYPEMAFGWELLGLSYLAQENLEEAIKFLEKAYSYCDSDMIVLNLASAYIKQTQHAKAFTLLQNIEKVRRIKEEAISEQLLWLKAVSASKSKMLAESIETLQKLLQLNPTNRKALKMLGRLYFNDYSYQEALIWYQRLYALDVENIDALHNIGAAYLQLRQADKAWECFQQVLSKDKNNTATLNACAAVKSYQGQFAEALKFIEEAEYKNVQANNPNNVTNTTNIPKQNRALLLLALGRQVEGWQAYEQRPKKFAYPLPKPIMNLPNCNNIDNIVTPYHLLIIHEQGIGDQIRFLSLMPALVERGIRPVVSLDSRLKELMLKSDLWMQHKVEFIDKVSIETHDDALVAKLDGKAFLGSLPYLLKLGCKGGAKAHNPLLKPDAKRQQQYRNYLSKHPHLNQQAKPCKRFYIGISWFAWGAGVFKAKKQQSFSDYDGFQNQMHGTAYDRYLPLNSLLHSLITKAGEYAQHLVFVNLQYGVGNINFDKLRKDVPVPFEMLTLNQLDLDDDFLGIASAIAAMDMMVGTSNTFANISGALGMDTRVLVPTSFPGLSWTKGSKRSQWFTSARVYHQTIPGQWKNPMDELAVDVYATLKQWVANNC